MKVKDYSSWRLKRIEERKDLYQCEQDPGLLSFITTVWNTPPKFLKILVDSLQDQVGGTQFEWVVLDNGTTEPETLKYLETIKSLPFVKYYRVEENLGIIRGMRFVLERATGKYVLPLDSDDYLYPDCVQIIHWFIQKNNEPALLYSDEDKLMADLFYEPYVKTDWDPVLFINSCYIAHLCVISRELALDLGAYSDRNADGCHDWDTFIRFYQAGHSPAHISEVIYSWRVHQGSTSVNVGSKDYIYASHRFVQNRYIENLPNPDHFYLDQSPLFRGAPDWWVRRKPVHLPNVLQVKDKTLVSTNGESFPYAGQITLDKENWKDALVSYLSSEGDPFDYVAIELEKVAHPSENWVLEAVGLFERFPDAAVVGGRVISGDNRVISAGGYIGFDDGFGVPEFGNSIHHPSYFGFNFKQRSVDFVSADVCLVETKFLLGALTELGPSPITWNALGPVLGVKAKEQSRRVIFSPHFSVKRPEALPENNQCEVSKELYEKKGKSFSNKSLYPSLLLRSSDSPYQLFSEV